MQVTLIDHIGTDLSVVDAARVSFANQSEWEEVTETRWETHSLLGDLPYDVKAKKLSDKDAKLIHYLAKHGHWSPFSHAYVKFRVKAPLFVARQLQKHTVGLAWNEVSRRYVSHAPEFYMPDVWRAKADNVKQGSSDDAVNEYQAFDGSPLSPSVEYKGFLEHAESLYNEFLGAGICEEQARMVLPQSMETEWIWSGSLYAFARVCKQRLDSHAQRETQEVAKMIHTHLIQLFPVSMGALLA